MANIVVIAVLGLLVVYWVVGGLLSDARRRRDQQRILDEGGPAELQRIAERQRFHDKYGY